MMGKDLAAIVAAGERPNCACHDMPMKKSGGPRLSWQCRVKATERERPYRKVSLMSTREGNESRQ